MINFSGWNHGGTRTSVAIAAVIALGCGGASHPSSDRRAAALEAEGRLWVLAPHPDDEVLMAGELLRAAIARGRPVSVVVMTNGDLSCTRDGHARQGETVAALASLGVRESDVHFLGYPDGYLDSLGPDPLAPLARTQPDGSCGLGDHTYASHGEGGVDVHTLLRGTPGAYVASGVEEDLAALLERDRPTEIVTSHGIDTHPDHAMAYVYLRRALERAAITSPRILRAIVHQGPCWPNGAGREPCPDVALTRGTPFPSLAAPLDGYRPTLRIESPDLGLAKRAAIARYVSQLGAPIADQSWLSSFARSDEIFFSETLTADPTRPGRLVRAGRARGEVGSITSSRPGALSVHHVAPLTLSFDAQLDPGGVARVAWLGSEGGAALSIELDDGAVALHRGDTLLRLLPTPHGEDPTLSHRYEVLVDPRPEEGPIAEVTVRRDGAIWMMAVIVAELPVSEATTNTRGFAGDEITYAAERGALGVPSLVE